MRCSEVREMISNDKAFRDFTTAERMAVAKHHYECEACQKWFDDYTQRVSEAHGPTNLVDDVLCQVEADVLFNKDIADPEAL